MKILSNKNKILPILLGIALLGSSCKKELNQGPINATYSQVFWTSQANVEEAVYAMYGQLRVALRDASFVDHQEGAFFIQGDLVAGTFKLAAGDTFLGYSLTPAKKFNFSYIPYWEPVLWNWSRYYKVIALCNSILEFVPKMNVNLFSNGDQQRNEFLAEAYFVRAYCYFYITKIWGDPVYVTKTYNDVDFGNILPIPRSPENHVLDSCLMDLRIAQNYTDYSGGAPEEAIRGNKGSIQALMANIFAWQHKDDSTHYYCQQVINNGGYSLEPAATYTNIWEGKSSAESIFEISMQYQESDPEFKSDNDWSEARFSFFGTFLQGAIVDNKKASGWTTEGLMFTDTANDMRFKTILTPSNNSNGYVMTKYSDFQYGDEAAKTNHYIDNNLVLMRLAGIYLLDAEALANEGKVEPARTQLKKVEERAGVTSYATPTNALDMLYEIMQEDSREFIGEGRYYFDLIRTNRKLHILENDPNIAFEADRVSDQNKGYYWPIQLSELIIQDPLLTQNPYWATHAGR